MIFSPQSEGVGQRLFVEDDNCQVCHALPPVDRPSGVVVNSSDHGLVFRSMTPIENRDACSQCHPSDQRLLGLLLTDFSITSIEEALAEDLRTNLVWWAGTLVAVAVAANLAINRMVLRRLGAAVKAIAAFGSGGLRDQLPEEPKDEIGELGEAFNTMASEVEQRQRENEDLSEALREQAGARGQLLRRLISAQEEERKRVARELHDDLGQSIGTTALTIELARRNVDHNPQTAMTHLADAHDLLSDASDRMYDLIMGLRPSVLDDLGLLPALEMQAGRCLDPAGISYQIESTGLEERLPAEIEVVLFRIFQEAITNAARHSDASLVSLRVIREDGFVLGEIEDNGIGFEPQELPGTENGTSGFGLLGMRERVGQCDGLIEIESSPGMGTSIHVHIPINEVSDV
jgi:signal transduction histidine kinase